MLYVTEKQRFYTKNWLGAKKLESVQAYVYYSAIQLDETYAQTITGQSLEYTVAGWKELMGRPDVYYRASVDDEFTLWGYDGCGV